MRRELLHHLRKDEKNVKQLAGEMDLTPNILSNHVSVMRSVGMIISRRQAQIAYYRISNARIFEATDIMGQVVLAQLRAGAKLTETFRG